MSFADILSCYEDIRYFDAEITGKKFSYAAKSSIHSDVTTFAYGKVLSRDCVDLAENGKAQAVLNLSAEDIKDRRFCIKITACMPQWKKYENDLTLVINGIKVFSGIAFFENVNLGWPSLYFPVGDNILQTGENKIEICCEDLTEAGLFLSCVRLVSLPEFKKNSQISAQRYVKQGADYAVAVYGAKNLKVSEYKNCEFKGIVYSKEIENTVLVKFRATCLGQAECVCEAEGCDEIRLCMPECVQNTDDFLVGMDSDDHRHDDSFETDEIIKFFALSGMGDYFQFRPQYGRNYVRLSDEKTWKRRIDFLKTFGITIGLSDCDNVLPYTEKYAREKYLGKHIHEPYLYFYRGLQEYPEKAAKYFIDGDILDRSQSFTESKEAYLRSLDKMYIKNARGAKGLSSVGAPSLLCVYEAKKFDRVTIEPVSGLALITGAVRGTMGKNGYWGAHVPVDWYFGAPNDRIKSNKFLVSMLYLYMNGAKYVYTENAVFKTNAFSREDYESDFCRLNRKYLREFYDYTMKNPRNGKLKTDLAIVYGNNEFFMWQTNERIAELGENDDWDLAMWGKWRDNRSQQYWRAAEEWLPYARNQNAVDDALNLRLFAGNPYGAVDVIPYESDYKKYKAIVFLGWNTYENELSEKLCEYVESGGVLFISYCHLNRTDRPDRKFEYANDERLEKLFGCRFGQIKDLCGNVSFADGETIEQKSALKIAECLLTGAEAIAADGEQSPVVIENRYGKGKVYFCTIADYTASDDAVAVLKRVMKKIAEEVSEIYCDNRNIALTERITEQGREIKVLNLSCAESSPQAFNITVKSGDKTQTIEGKLAPCEMKTYVKTYIFRD